MEWPSWHASKANEMRHLKQLGRSARGSTNCCERAIRDCTDRRQDSAIEVACSNPTRSNSGLCDDVESPFVSLNFKSRLGNDGGQEGVIKHGNGGPQKPGRHRPRVLGNTEEGPRAGCPSPPRMVGSKGLLQRPL